MSYVSHLPILLRRTLHFGCPIGLDPALPALNPFEAVNDALFSGHYTLLKHLLGKKNKDMRSEQLYEEPFIEAIVDMWTDNKKITKLICENKVDLKRLYTWKHEELFSMKAYAPTSFEKYLVILATYGHPETLDAVLKQDKHTLVNLLFATNMACTSKHANIRTLRCLRKYGAALNISIFMTGAISDPAELEELVSWEQDLTDLPSVTGLYIACAHGNLNYVRWILGETTTITWPRASFEILRNEQVALFARAISYSQLEIIKLLMRHFAVPGDERITFIDCGSFWTASVEVIEAVVALVGTSTLKQMALMFACKGNHKALAWIFALQDIPFGYGSVECGSYEVLELIASIDINYILHLRTWKQAISRNDYQMLMWLKQHLEHPKVERYFTQELISELQLHLKHMAHPRLLAFKLF